MTYEVSFTQRADRSLTGLGKYLAIRFSELNARKYQASVALFCKGLQTFPERGTVQHNFGPDIRSIGFRGELTILFRVNKERQAVVILDLFYRGRTIHL